MIPRRALNEPIFDRHDLEQLDLLRAERDRLRKLDARWRLRPRSSRCRALQARLVDITRQILETEHAMECRRS